MEINPGLVFFVIGKTRLSKFGCHGNDYVDVHVKTTLKFQEKVAKFGGDNLTCFEVIKLFSRGGVCGDGLRLKSFLEDTFTVSIFFCEGFESGNKKKDNRKF